MPIYEFRCRNCGQVYEALRPDPPDLVSPCFCGQTAIRRVWQFSYVSPMQEGFNTSVGKNISNMAQLKSEFSRMSDEAEMVTGNPHNFQPIDPMDKKALGITDEGLASTHDQLIFEGKHTQAKRLLKP